jgi:hypothetical protein
LTAKVADSDVFVGLVGPLHGSRPEGSVLSYTELEYEEATKRNKPRKVPFHLQLLVFPTQPTKLLTLLYGQLSCRR